jgi:hypothetical protein
LLPSDGGSGHDGTGEVSAEITGAISATAQRLRYSSGSLRSQANDLDEQAHKLVESAKRLRRDAKIIEDRANDLDEEWEKMS